ncbi:hypothetical protein Droror1_Dr00000271 [Drosera rotundifolia]
MERGRSEREVVPCDSSSGANASRFRSSFAAPSPDYGNKAVQDALRHLASIDLIELCNEAKVEHCRAIRDLSSCGRPVESVLQSCGHPSLCEECSQRCDYCPICRAPLPKNGNKLRLRLYYECIKAGLISRIPEERMHDEENDETHITDDVLRLYSLFDISMENNLSCLVCQYVTDVCMNETAVSSDPTIAFLLDEAVVKIWCRRTFRYTTAKLQEIYKCKVTEMKSMVNSLPKLCAKLAGLSDILEVLESSFKGAHSAKLDDLHHLLEAILKTKQHMEMMMWCIRHEFLENVRSRHINLSSWRKIVHDRKSAAIYRVWPDYTDNPTESTEQDRATLFIEDALVNLQTEKRCEQESMVESEIVTLLSDEGSSLFRAQIEGLTGQYPFENLRVAVDVLFLLGSSDMVIAKRAIFLYYLFDRFWSMPNEIWRPILDDFAVTFGVSRLLLLESFTFYLLDDHSDQALQEACRFLPEISGPNCHPKIAKVLLERDASDAALMFLRLCGHDGGSDPISLDEAVSAVRVRIESGLLTEAFLYQRAICSKLKEKKVTLDNTVCDIKSWMHLLDVLVTEICYLCVRRHLLDRMIELPWNSDEEKHLHQCLLDCVIGSPSTNVGSLLVVYYLQRHRYVDAHRAHCELTTVEDDFMSKNDVGDEILHRMRSTIKWRAGLVNKCVELLPEDQRQQLKSAKFSEGTSSQYNETEGAEQTDTLESRGAADFLLKPSPSPSPLLQIDHEMSTFTPSRGLKYPGSMPSSKFEYGNLTPPSLPLGRFSVNLQSGDKPKFSILDGDRKLYPFDASAEKQIRRTSLRVFPDYELRDSQPDDTTPMVEDQNGFYGELPKISPPFSRRIMAKPVRTPFSNRGLHDDSRERYTTASGKRHTPTVVDQPWNLASPADSMEISWSHEQSIAAAGIDNSNGVSRWRSDDDSDGEDQLENWVRIRGAESGRKFVSRSRGGRSSLRR